VVVYGFVPAKLQAVSNEAEECFACCLQHVKPRLAELLPVYQALLQAFDNGSLGAAGEKQAGQ
jgi:hypothetical protein